MGGRSLRRQRARHVIYCSNSGGNDANDGLSADHPVQTLARGIAMLRDHSADQLLLKARRRVEFRPRRLAQKREVGRSADAHQRVWLGRPSAAAHRRRVRLDAIASSNPEINNVSIIGIHFESDGRNTASPTFVGPVNATGINVLTKTSNFLVEDCRIEGYAENINVQAFYGARSAMCRYRRNVIDDAYATPPIRRASMRMV